LEFSWRAKGIWGALRKGGKTKKTAVAKGENEKYNTNPQKNPNRET